jgi:hypothetical protein
MGRIGWFFFEARDTVHGIILRNPVIGCWACWLSLLSRPHFSVDQLWTRQRSLWQLAMKSGVFCIASIGIANFQVPRGRVGESMLYLFLWARMIALESLNGELHVQASYAARSHKGGSRHACAPTTPVNCWQGARQGWDLQEKTDLSGQDLGFSTAGDCLRIWSTTLLPSAHSPKRYTQGSDSVGPVVG